jgi:hypothetical protein
MKQSFSLLGKCAGGDFHVAPFEVIIRYVAWKNRQCLRPRSGATKGWESQLPSISSNDAPTEAHTVSQSPGLQRSK